MTGSSLAAYTADRLPRTTAIARTAVQIARVNRMSNRVGAAVRDTVIAAQSRATPALFPRSLYGMRDWWPPGQPYASDEVRYPERTP
ncbi:MULTISPECIES: hypothetical protein [unclassified Streptomyces]|uniref:hypothetical protein n=1 Tax=unclassified Streptomyces TaxID=2593676 RepID=UPI002E8238FA|nr:hypothetical protein [Streptomyces sp. NBC_00589]WTI40870.1 hypothetical protein OIC96_40690 [Streptomyces sp. NBC_00775]WUB25445.1 hypothetical protein OHA51_09040 [Streptomyces sp. NBC_00589]